MKRDYADGVQDDVIYFTGYEVEKTPAEGEHTLFVTGCQPLEDVLAQAKEHTVEHIYLGANHSFVPKESWEDLVQGLLNKKFLVTLDVILDTVSPVPVAGTCASFVSVTIVG